MHKPLFSYTNTHAQQSLHTLAVLASGTGSNFRAIVRAIKSGRLNINIAGLIYNIPGAGCSEIANEYGIPSVNITNTEYPNRESFDRAVLEQLKHWEVDLVVMAGWMRIATPTLITPFAGRITNLHPSLLPSFRGLHAIEQAYGARVAITGCTVHLVTEALDDGPILGQAALPIDYSKPIDDLKQAIHLAEHELYVESLRRFIVRN